MIENALDNILTKLAERDYWDIEVLWNRFGVELPILEWLDSQGLIELRKVSLYQDTNTTERTKLKPWYSPTSTSESWWKYFPRTSSDRKQRKPWRTVLPDSKVKIFDLFKNSPVELRVSVAGREMLTHRVAMSAQRKLMQVNDARLHASISSVDAILSRPVTVDSVAKKVPNSKNDRKPDGDFQPAKAFPKSLRPVLRAAVSKNRKVRKVRKITHENEIRYSMEDAMQWWPEQFKK